MPRVLPVVVALVLAVYTLIDCLQTDSAKIRSLNKPAWLAIILLLPVVGPVLWLVVAKRGTRPKPVQQPTTAPPPPDDNPEFLRELRNLDQEHEKLLNEWEESLRRREKEHRQQRSDESPRGDDDTSPQDQPTAQDEPAEQNDNNATEEELRKRGDGGDDDPR